MWLTAPILTPDGKEAKASKSGAPDSGAKAKPDPGGRLGIPISGEVAPDNSGSQGGLSSLGQTTPSAGSAEAPQLDPRTNRSPRSAPRTVVTGTSGGSTSPPDRPEETVASSQDPGHMDRRRMARSKLFGVFGPEGRQGGSGWAPAWKTLFGRTASLSTWELFSSRYWRGRRGASAFPLQPSNL